MRQISAILLLVDGRPPTFRYATANAPLTNLSELPSQRVEGLRSLLKGGVAVATGKAAVTAERSLPQRAVAAALGAARGIGLDSLLAQITRTGPAKFSLRKAGWQPTMSPFRRHSW